MSVIFPINVDPRFRLTTAVGGETTASVPFPFQDNDDIALVKYEIDGTEVPWTEGVHYTLTGAGNPGGGTATFTAPLIAGEQILRVGRAVLDRVASVVRSGRFKSKAIDDDIDRFIIIAQELYRDSQRAWKAPFGKTPGLIDVGRPGHTAVFNEGGGLSEGPNADHIEAAEQFANEAKQARDEAVEAAAGAGVTDGDKVDVVVSGAGANWQVKRSSDADAVAGTSDDDFMTPLSTAKAITSRLSKLPIGEANGIPPRKLFPTVVTNEALAYAFPSVQRWEDGGGTARMTRAFYQSRFDDMAALGVEHYVEMYVEYRGSWFYEPSFAYPYDYDTSRSGMFWHDRLTAPDDVNLERFDFIDATLERCDELGIDVWWGLSRQGDTPLAQDLYDVNVLSQPDPVRYGLSLSTRLNNAATRALQLADDLFTRYGHHSSFAGFKLGHESAHIPSANNYNTLVNVTGIGGFHPLNWYRDNHSIRSMIVPAKLVEGAINITSSTYAQAVVDSGADVFTWQNAAGPGLNYQLADYTWLPRAAFSFTPTNNRQKYGGRVRRLIQRANGYSRVKGRRIENWSIGEVWRMGHRPNAALTIGSGFGTPGTTGVTFSSVGSFSGATVGSTITTIGGKATVTSASGAPDSVVATINRAFEASSFAADSNDPKWAWSKGYLLPYAALPAEYQFELPHELAGFERTAIYSWNFVANPSAALRPPLSFNDRTDYRTRMESLFDAIAVWREDMVERLDDWRPVTFIDRQVEAVTGLSGAAITQDLAVYSPKLPGTFARVKLVVGFGKAPSPVQTGATGNATISLTINGVTMDTRTIYDNDGWMGGSVELGVPEWYLTTGTDQTFGMTATSTAPGLVSVKATIEIEEYMRP